MTVVVAGPLTFPAASRAVTERTLVELAFKPTTTVQLPARVVEAVEVLDPPVTVIEDPASAVPAMRMALALVVKGSTAGDVMTGTAGAVTSGVPAGNE